MLLPRVISAIIMALIFAGAVFYLDELGFMLFIGVVLLIAAWEWAQLAGIKEQVARIAFAGGVGALSYGVAIFELQHEMLWFTPFLWCLALYWVACYPAEKSWKNTAIRLLFGAVVLLTTWCAFVLLKQSPQFLTYLFILAGLVWGADSGAYCFGRLFGKRKLARYVSPGKSWEGALGGVFCTQMGVLTYVYIEALSWQVAMQYLFIALATVIVSVLGDLTESLFKRHESLKDSSQLIPGHGGVMDRIDSITSAAPVFVLILLAFGWL